MSANGLKNATNQPTKPNERTSERLRLEHVEAKYLRTFSKCHQEQQRQQQKTLLDWHFVGGGRMPREETISQKRP